MSNISIKLEKKDIETSPIGINFMIRTGLFDLVFSDEAIEELIADYMAHKNKSNLITKTIDISKSTDYNLLVCDNGFVVRIHDCNDANVFIDIASPTAERLESLATCINTFVDDAAFYEKTKNETLPDVTTETVF